MKLVVVINGSGGAGKDTMISFAAEKYSVMNVSVITPIKDAARQVGWAGKKDEKSRKFLSDLKMLSTGYNDYPMSYLKEKYDDFMKSKHSILFVAIREPDDIRRFIDEACGKAVTLLIRRPDLKSKYGNSADDGVENYDYDFVYENYLPLYAARKDFMEFLHTMIITVSLRGIGNE